MGVPKISGFLISLLLVALFATSFSYLIANVSKPYDVEYNNETFESYNKINQLSNDIEATKNNITTQLELDPGLLDVIGAYLKGGYKTLKISLNSFEVFSSVAEETLSDSNLGTNQELYNPVFISQLKTTLVLIVLVLVLFIIIGIFVGREKI